MLYLTFKSLHIISVVTWFAGLFYLGRLFVYHKEIEQESLEEYNILHKQFTMMESRLWRAITQPSMVIALSCGTALAWLSQTFTTQWLMTKLLLVAVLVGYHFFCDKVRLELEVGECSWSGRSLRLLNEVPAVLLIGIIFVVVFKEMLTLWTLLGILISFAGLIIISVLLFARKRRKQASSHQ